MRCLVTIQFTPGHQDAIAALLPAEQVKVRELMAQGVIKTIHIAADRSRIWLAVEGESPDHVHQILTSLPLYPYMDLELTPLLELPPSSEGV